MFKLSPYDVPISNDKHERRKAEEEIIRDMQNVKNQVKQVFTPSRLRKAAALAVLTGVISAGGTYWEHQNHDRMAASPLAESAATSTAPAQSDFRPFYKVKCYAGNVEYKLRIDAVTGTVLSSKVDVDDNIF